MTKNNYQKVNAQLISFLSMEKFSGKNPCPSKTKNWYWSKAELRIFAIEKHALRNLKLKIGFVNKNMKFLPKISAAQLPESKQLSIEKLKTFVSILFIRKKVKNGQPQPTKKRSNYRILNIPSRKCSICKSNTDTGRTWALNNRDTKHMQFICVEMAKMIKTWCDIWIKW